MHKDTIMRLSQFDYLKGVGIVLVLIGHAHVSSDVFTSLYLFHMPLFFAASGCFFKFKEGQCFKDYALKKAKRLLVPYLFFLSIFICFNLLEVVFWHDEGELVSGIIVKLIQFATGLLGNAQSLAYRTLWFLVCLFEVSILYWFMAQVKNVKKRTLLSLGLFTIGYMLQVAKINVPYFIDSTLSVQLFYHIGYLFYNKGWHEKQFSPWASVVSLLIIFVCFNQANAMTDYRTNTYALASVPLALLILWNLYNLFLALSKSQLATTKSVEFLHLLGIESMVIYGLHRNFFLMIDGLLKQYGINEYFITLVMVPVAIMGCLWLSKPLTKHIPRMIGK